MWQRIKPWLGAVASILASVAAFVLFAWVFTDSKPMTEEERERLAVQYLPAPLRDRPVSNDVQQQ